MSTVAAHSNTVASSPYVNFTSDQARQHLLLDIARRFKGICPIVDAKIDAAADQIAGRPGIKRIPGHVAGEPRVPMYMEGEPGVGKTTLIRAAIQDFCKIAGLKFIESPADGYKFGENDFYYCTVNLSGKTNAMDIGGLPSKGELEVRSGMDVRHRATDAGEWLLAELVSRAKMGGGMAKLQVTETPEYTNGGLRGLDVTLKGEAANVDLVSSHLLRQLSLEMKQKGVSLNILKDGETPEDGRLYYRADKGTAGVRISVLAPQRMDADVEYVAEMLPNRRFAMASKARFSLFNFDDVANASESVRNVLLEVAQSNRYSGVMDIGNALVTFTGNMGSEDGTNTQSEQSDAEVTRVFKVRIRDTPKDWARRIAGKYAETGDCLMSTFIDRHGNEPNVFREGEGDLRSDKGIPKPNSRSLENALAKALPYFMMAKESGQSPTIFSDEIEIAVKGSAGVNVATRYKAFMVSMLTKAIPLADELMTTGKLNERDFEKFMGAGAKSTEQDFAFRFGAAVADAFVNRIAFSDEATAAVKGDKDAAFELIADSTDRLCVGLARLEPGTMTYSLSRVMARFSGISKLAINDGVEVKLEQSTFMAMAEGFARAANKNLWPDFAQAKKDFTSVVAGSNIGQGSNTKANAKP